MVLQEQVRVPDSRRGDVNAQSMVPDDLRSYSETRDPAIRDRIVECHLGLVRQLARRFATQGESLDDLVQAGSIGLLKAIEGFDPSLGFGFSGYAAATIIGELKRHLRDRGWAVRPPRRIQELCLELGHVAAELTQRLGRSPTIPELATETGSSEQDVLEALEAGHAYRGIPLETSEYGANQGSVARLGLHDGEISSVESRMVLHQLLDSLNEQERTIVELRFFEELTQAEIGARLGISQMQVSRLLARILHQLREMAATGD